MENTDEIYMHRAIELAKKGCGWTNPNPLVGAVIVKNGHVIGEGYHEKYGEKHAERNALAHCREDAKGATIYVTLEPCCHYGKQPPCTQAIIESGISKVVIGSDDPNPLVAGKGIQILKANGIEVVTGVLKKECDSINEIFFHYMNTGRPLVTMKYAMTIDGKIATYTGKSQWITGEKARKHVHEQRNRHMAIMTGVGTVIADDPMLNCRIENGRDPIRIICDTNLRIPLESRIVRTSRKIPTIIATATDYSDEKNVKAKALKEAGCNFINPGVYNGHIDLNNLVELLGNGNEETIKKIDSIYLEGGQSMNWSAISSGIVDKVNIYMAPKIFGGEKAYIPVGGMGVENPNEAIQIKNTKIIQLGDDYMLEGDVCSRD